MALSQKHRNSIYTAWAPVLGEAEAEALLSQFPSTDLDVPATKEFVQMTVRTEVAVLRAEMHAGFAEVEARFQQMTIWMAGAVFTSVGLATTISSVVS